MLFKNSKNAYTNIVKIVKNDLQLIASVGKYFESTPALFQCCAGSYKPDSQNFGS
jgi:hypothetical protein